MIIPAIDLKDGHSVRLYQGDYAKQMLVAQVPEEQAKAIDEAGLNALHLVDLDGAKAKHPVNTETVRKIRRNFEGYIELGGGIRTLEDISACLEIGIDRVILGSVAVTDPELVKNALQKFGEEKIAIGIDGTKQGFDIDLYQQIGEAVHVPIIASGGAGKKQDFLDVFQKTPVTGALAASLFHFGELKIEELKKYLEENGVNVRR